MKKKQTSLDGGALKCLYCSKEFRYDSDRKRHESSHNPAQFVCNLCSKSFSFLSALRRHEKQHNRSGNVICDKCNRKFRDETLLKRHMQYAHKGTVGCLKCLAVFNSDAALRTHSLIHKPKSERKYHCQYEGCNKSFNFPHHLQNHELTHTNEKKYFCNVCGKGFIQIQNLKNHLNTHEPDALLCCTVKGCFKKFATEYSRKKHVKSHDLKIEKGLSEVPKVIPKAKVANHNEKCEAKHENDDNDKKKDLVKQESIEGPAKGNYCQTALGNCMVSRGPEMEENCLCAQMSKDIKVLDNNLDFETNDTPNNETVNSSVDVKMELQCSSCDCGGEKINEPVLPRPKHCKDSMPSLEFRSDGVIKLIETFDVNIPFVEKGRCRDVKSVDNIPNSCKAVLGNCIVSGDDTIGEGCLCARMSAAAQQISDQEMEEFTIGNVFDA